MPNPRPRPSARPTSYSGSTLPASNGTTPTRRSPTPPSTAPRSDHWLTRARLARADRRGNFWDSADLSPGWPGEHSPAARFLHGLQLTGMAPITRANDPFWNVRAFDNALSRHDGYRLSSFICALNQLVMDDITGAPSLMSDHRDTQIP